MDTIDRIAEGRTLAELQGFTPELGAAVAALAEGALAADRLGVARRLLEGLAVTNPRDPVAWALLATVYRRQGQPEAGRVCAEAAVRLAPGDARARLARAELLLLSPEERGRGLEELRGLAPGEGPEGNRARLLLTALGEGGAARP